MFASADDDLLEEVWGLVLPPAPLVVFPADGCFDPVSLEEAGLRLVWLAGICAERFVFDGIVAGGTTSLFVDSSWQLKLGA